MIGDREFRWVLNPTGTRPVLVLPNNVRPFEEITPEDITRARAAVLEQARNEATTAVGEAIDRVAQGG